MDYRELDRDDCGVSVGKKLQMVSVKSPLQSSEMFFCEECLSTEGGKKCIATRKVLKFVDTQHVQYIINRYPNY